MRRMLQDGPPEGGRYVRTGRDFVPSGFSRTWRLWIGLLAAAVSVALATTARVPARGGQPAASESLRASGQGLQSADLYRLRSAGDVRLSPDGTRVAYTVVNNDRLGRPYSQIWLMELRSGAASLLGDPASTGSNPLWSPDGRQLAYVGRSDGQAGVIVARSDGSSSVLVAPIVGTNHPLPSSGDAMSWSPDGRQIAYLSATPGPEPESKAASGDPLVITRYLYKPTASEGSSRFNDNRRLHIFVADLASKTLRQLTRGSYYEHSIDWSPTGDEIVFISNREPDPDRVFNYDIFAVNVTTSAVRRLTDTRHAEYRPAWSPDGKSIAYLGTRRSLTSSETTMEDTHVWVVDRDGGNRRELGGAIDNRQGTPVWSSDGAFVYFTVQERGNVRLYRISASGGIGQRVTGDTGTIGGWSLGKNNTIAYALATPGAPAELYVRDDDRGSGVGDQGSGTRDQESARNPQSPIPNPRSPVRGARRLTALNGPLLAERRLAGVESFVFPSFDGTEIEAFLTKPAGTGSGPKLPLIVMIHGGPHGQQGPAFNAKAQVYARHGWASLMVNYRGSTGYGQTLADAIFRDQNGGEAKDVLAGVDAAIARYPWIDSDRLGIEGGSYGGQLTNWIVTVTDRFKAAIPSASIANLVSFNYMAYYHDYLAVEFGSFPHQNNLMDLLWERSPLRYVARVKTPTMLIHGENDNDVPIAEAEQFFIALKDAGVETVMVRYPREGHGLRETKHVVDALDRSIAWYERHFKSTAPTAAR